MVGGRRGRFPDYATKSGVRWLSHKAMHRTGTLVRRALAEDGNSGDRDTISDGRAATLRRSRRGDGGIVDIVEFAIENYNWKQNLGSALTRRRQSPNRLRFGGVLY